MNRTRQQFEHTTPLYTVCALLLLLLLCLPWNSHADSPHHVVIITSSDSNYQQLTAARIRSKLEVNGARTMIVSSDEIASSSQNGRTLYVAIGNKAIQNLDEFDSNAITLRLINRATPGSKYTSTKSDLITAQPDCRHIKLVKSINPDWTSIGVLSSLDSIDTAAALTKCAIRYNLNLRVYAITDKSDLLVTLESAVEDNHVLLAISDPLVYNKTTVKNILLTAYRHRKPVIGYSDSFVLAGAVAAIYTSPESAGDRAAKIITGFFDNSWQFNKNVYHIDEFSISLNTQVATSLDILLPDKESIRKSIDSMGTKR